MICVLTFVAGMLSKVRGLLRKRCVINNFLSSCALTCHSGHKLLPMQFSSFYCDCTVDPVVTSCLCDPSTDGDVDISFVASLLNGSVM